MGIYQLRLCQFDTHMTSPDNQQTYSLNLLKLTDFWFVARITAPHHMCFQLNK